jgi:hypothetical protein
MCKEILGKMELHTSHDLSRRDIVRREGMIRDSSVDIRFGSIVEINCEYVNREV